MLTWLLGFGLVAYLGLDGGGYDPLVHDKVGIGVWWVVLLGALVGVLPRRRPGPLAWAVLGLFAAFVAWTALSLIWTESAERTSADLARVLGYAGVLTLAIFLNGGRRARLLAGAVGAGIVWVAIVALLSRLHPDWFPEADQVAQFLTGGRERLSYPLNYWNGLAALIAIGIPLILDVATGARTILLRALAAAALPVMALTAFLTLSRGGIAAAIIALAVFVAIASDRLPKLLTLLVTGAGSAVLVLAADRREALQEGFLNATAQRQGDEMVPIVLGVCLAVGLVHAALSHLLAEDRRPRWTHATPRQAWIAAGLGLLAALVVLAAIDAPGRVSNGWEEFKKEEGPGGGAERLTSAAGQSRYQLWGAAVDQNATEPLAGTGSGTFEYWWAREGETEETVRDTHSLYMQTLGELGIVGLALLAAFLLAVLGVGAWSAIRAGPGERSAPAAALAGCIAFCITAVFDWMWQLPVLPVAFLLLAALLVGGAVRRAPDERSGMPLLPRLAVGVTAAVAIVAIAIPLASTSLVRESEAQAREGDLPAALDSARSAENVQPSAASPRLQQALVLEAQGDLAAAAAAARAATERESTNWRTWFVLSRIEAERGRAIAAVRHYRRARSLNPHFSLFD